MDCKHVGCMAVRTGHLDAGDVDIRSLSAFPNLCVSRLESGISGTAITTSSLKGFVIQTILPGLGMATPRSAAVEISLLPVH